ncbi:unnamed protein product [Rotaria magnacalcarata]|uniref:Uncharacterized protein n=2 Tax=Rotaria magnacalcarata TaxID=392030 RepID=A0A815HJ46_9BILA|nr:unnamed protein product [Rotaria magnacalcarata]CAF2076671.1 unnamed protein product [Rotaria magnacalcarata]
MMRYFKVIRARRRTTASTNELAQSIIQSSDLTTIPRRPSSILLVNNEIYHSSSHHSENDNLIPNGRHAICTPNNLLPIDHIDLSRRSSVNISRRSSFQQQDITESSKSKTSLKNFYIFFVLLFLFIFFAVIYSFIRMIKNQS